MNVSLIQPTNRGVLWVAGNGKNQQDLAASIALATTLNGACIPERLHVAYAPKPTALAEVSRILDASSSSFAGKLFATAQNVDLGAGSVTDIVSVRDLQELRVKLAIVGHSDRRGKFGETDTLVLQKANLLLDHGITPIWCIGERPGQDFTGTLTVQLAAFGGLRDRMGQAFLAYEPIASIKTPENPGAQALKAEEANDRIKLIRQILESQGKSELARMLSIWYGGSVDTGNVAALFSQEEIDGGLVATGFVRDARGMIDTLIQAVPDQPSPKILVGDEDIKEAMPGLTAKKRKAVKLLFGLGGDKPKTLEEVGHILRLTREEVRQIKIRALREWRETRSRELKKYLRKSVS